MNPSVVAWAALGAVLALVTKGRRRRNGGRVMKAAAAGAVVALVAPRLGVRLPSLPMVGARG